MKQMLPALLALAFLLSSLPVAAASKHCGASITPAGHWPPAGTYTSAVHLNLVARFSDDIAHCGANNWSWTFNGHEWSNLGTATLEGSQYVMRTTAYYDYEGAIETRARIEENCCDSTGAPPSGSQSWVITIHFCNDDYPATYSPSGNVDEERPTISVSFEQTDSLCPIESGQLLVDGIVRDTSIRKSGTTYTLSWTPGSPLVPGAHHIQAQVTQKCCESKANTPKVNTMEGGFNVLSCGDNLHQVDETRPHGTRDDPQPTIEVVFRDVDRSCGFVDYGMSLDGFEVNPTYEELGAGVVALRYTPPLPLAPGPHAVSAFVTERCCAAAGTPTHTETAWTFTTLAAPGTAVGHNASVPGVGSNIILGGPTYVPGYNDPFVPAGWDPFWLPLPGPLEVQAGVSEMPLGILVDPAHTADETRIPTPLTTITVCREGSMPCPAPLVDPATGSLTYTVEVKLAGQTLLRDSRTIPLIP